MSLFGSLYIGTSGLQTSQNALNTVAHNLSNVDTSGYTRQQVAQADRSYTTISVDSKAVSNKQTGLGVYYSQVRQVRDYFLDQTYREEVGRMSFYQVSYGAFNEVEDLLGELNGESFNDSLGNLWEAVEELAKEPSSTVKQGLLVQRASQFLERAQAVYQDMSDYQDNLNAQIKGNVDRVNEIANQIYDLNNSILKIETGGFENANDLRDERNALLDELGSLIHINYSEDYDGAVIVKAEGHQLVTRNSVFEIGTYADSDTGFYTPYWKQDSKAVTLADGTTIPDLTNCTVFDLTQTIATDRDTDIGTIKAQLLARGDHRANYTDTEVDQETYNQTTGQSVIMNVQAEFDKLVHSIATQMNAALADAADADNGYMVDGNGNPIQLFQKIATSGYDENGNYVEEDLTPGGESTLYTIANMTINPDLKKEAALLSFIRPDGKEDYATAQKLQEVFTDEDYTLNPNVTNKSNLIDFYSNIISQVSYSGSVFKSVYENQSTTVDSTEAARQQVVGVSDDEELTNMIKFQNAYNASSRYINVINEMIEHIINTLGA
jgi:flagellar hook-associated protein 1 FlgK